MSQTRPNVLVVDDEPDICANLCDILTDLGYPVDVAHNGEEALQLVRKKPYAVALLDLRMPGMDGLELYRQIKLVQSATVAIIVTAYSSSETVTQALHAGAWKVVRKPVELGRLLPLIEEAAEQPLVLVVDDDTELCETMWELLREQGFRVALAHDSRMARHCLEQAAAHVVLIDMRLPQGNGAEVFHMVRAAAPQSKTILITGYRSEVAEMVQQAQAAGADAVCYKPFDVRSLLETVSRLSG
ncbi:MAG: response regulator [Pirellulales bacterium]